METSSNKNNLVLLPVPDPAVPSKLFLDSMGNPCIQSYGPLASNVDGVANPCVLQEFVIPLEHNAPQKTPSKRA
jgi:hypothetical protein